MGSLSELMPRVVLLEEQSARLAQQAMRQQSIMEDKLDQLLKYRSEYKIVEVGVPTLMLDAQCFLDRLDQNINEMRASLDRQKKMVMLESNRWHSMHARRLALQKMIDKQVKTQRVKDRRKEIVLAESLQSSRRLLNSKKD